jgi:hypothetical protein
MIYNLNSNFVRVEWLLAELWLLNLYFLLKFEQKYKFKGHSSAKKSFDRNEIRT